MRRPHPPPPAAATESADPEGPAWRRDEAVILKALGQPEARKGQTLTIQGNGKVVLTLRDSDTEAWVLTRVLRMTRNGVEQVHYEVARHLIGESDDPSSVLFDQNGARLDSYDGWTTWRGAMAAISWSDLNYDGDPEASDTIELRDMSVTPYRRYVFKARCNAVSWTSDTELKAVCSRPAVEDAARGVALNGISEDIEAVIRRVGPNAWRLREVQAPKASLRAIENNPPTPYDETVTGEAYADAPSAPN